MCHSLIFTLCLCFFYAYAQDLLDIEKVWYTHTHYIVIKLLYTQHSPKTVALNLNFRDILNLICLH